MFILYTEKKKIRVQIITYTMSPPRYLWLICSQSLTDFCMNWILEGVLHLESVAALHDGTKNSVPGTHILYDTCILYCTPHCTGFMFQGQGSCLLWPPEDTWERKMLNKHTEGFIFSLSHPFLLPDSHKFISSCQPAQNISICLKAYFSKVIESGFI